MGPADADMGIIRMAMVVIRLLDKVEKRMMISSCGDGFVTSWGCRNKFVPASLKEFEGPGCDT